jgi:hypothetical protein
MTQMHTLPELETSGLHAVRMHLEQQYGQDIDFSLLLSVVLPEEQLVEKNEVWDEDLLLTEVVSELESGKERVAERSRG